MRKVPFLAESCVDFKKAVCFLFSLFFFLTGGKQLRRFISSYMTYWSGLPHAPALAALVIAGLCSGMTPGWACPMVFSGCFCSVLVSINSFLGISSQHPIHFCWAVFSQLYKVIFSVKMSPIQITSWQFSTHDSRKRRVNWGKLTSLPQNFTYISAFFATLLLHFSFIQRWRKSSLFYCLKKGGEVMTLLPIFLPLTCNTFSAYKKKGLNEKTGNYLWLFHSSPLYLTLPTLSQGKGNICDSLLILSLQNFLCYVNSNTASTPQYIGDCFCGQKSPSLEEIRELR